MKKIVTLLLALMLCLGSFPAFADVDLSGYTQEELLALRDSINQELLKRGIEKVVSVPQGFYVVGEDIPAGTYTLNSDGVTALVVHTSKAYEDYFFIASVSYEATVGKLTLENGNYIEITGYPLIFTPYQGLGF